MRFLRAPSCLRPLKFGKPSARAGEETAVAGSAGILFRLGPVVH